MSREKVEVELKVVVSRKEGIKSIQRRDESQQG